MNELMNPEKRKKHSVNGEHPPLDSVEACHRAIRTITGSIVKAESNYNKLVRNKTRTLTDDEHRQAGDLHRRIAQLQEGKHQVRRRLRELTSDTEIRFERYMMRVTKEYVSAEEYAGLVRAAQALMDADAERRIVSNSVGSAIGVIGNSGGMKRRMAI